MSPLVIIILPDEPEIPDDPLEILTLPLDPTDRSLDRSNNDPDDDNNKLPDSISSFVVTDDDPREDDITSSDTKESPDKILIDPPRVLP